MSELKVDKVSPRTGNYVSLNTVGMKNIVINGDMSLAQRSTSVASITVDGYYTCDRWNVGIDSFGTWTQSQSSDVPSGYGFATSLKMDCTTAQASPASSSVILLEQKFEGQNLQYLKYGTANAEQVTLSFWHKHTKTGTNIVELLDADNSDAVSGSYTQSVSNTWEQATITFPAKTSGALDNNNAVSLRLRFIMGSGTDNTSGTLATTWVDTIVNADRYVGQVNNADSTSNDFIITGVQLEAGTTASDFEFLPVDVNLGRCQRYFEKSYALGTAIGTVTSTGRAYNYGSTDGGSNLVFYQPFLVSKRATPTMTVYLTSGTSGSWDIGSSSGGATTKTVNALETGQNNTSFYFTLGGAINYASAYCFGHWVANSEL
jgi:hypothetical protein